MPRISLGASPARSCVLLGLALGAAACADPPLDPSTAPIVQPETVDNPPIVALASSCEPLSEEERVLAVSPEGDLWSRTTEGLRVRSVSDATTDLPIEGEVGFLVAWSDRVATAVIDGELWRIEPDGARYLFVPMPVRQPSVFCGDVERDGQAAIINAEGVFERAAGQWYSLGPEEGASFPAMEWLALSDGACAAPQGGLWFGAGEMLYRVDTAQLAVFRLPEASGPAVVGEAFGVAVPADDRVLFANERGPGSGQDWVPVTFVKGTVEAIAGSSGALWVMPSGHLYRFNGSWSEADARLPQGASHLYAHAAGGVWVQGTSEVCHIGDASLKVRGIRPQELVSMPTVDFVVQTDSPVQARVDDRPVVEAVAGETEGDWLFEDFALGAPGWHELRLEAGGPHTAAELSCIGQRRLLGVGHRPHLRDPL